MKRTLVGLLALVLAQGAVVVAGSAADARPGAPAVRAAAPAASASTPYCKRPARGFVPTRAAIPAIGRSVRIIQVKRTRSGAVGAGPVTERGKWLMAMDPHNRPASRHGSVLLSGHTWPDGTALGNAMLRNLHEGDRIVLAGKNHRRACYQVTLRKSYHRSKVPTRSAFRTSGRERVVIVTCSGRRLGPGNWTRRTLWYASPVLPPKPAAPAPAPSDPAGGGSFFGGLLGGLLGG